jgi:hypothetical protein
MTYFRVDGVSLTQACNHCKGLMAKAKEIYFLQGVEAAQQYVKEQTKNGFRTKKVHEKEEDIKGRRLALHVSASFMARMMGYSASFYCSIERNGGNYSETFYERFKKSERKLKRLFGKK